MTTTGQRIESAARGIGSVALSVIIFSVLTIDGWIYSNRLLNGTLQLSHPIITWCVVIVLYATFICVGVRCLYNGVMLLRGLTDEQRQERLFHLGENATNIFEIGFRWVFAIVGLGGGLIFVVIPALSKFDTQPTSTKMIVVLLAVIAALLWSILSSLQKRR